MLEAMVYCNLNVFDWQRLSTFERAKAVAQYRIHHLIEAHSSDAAKSKGGRGRRRDD